MKPSLASIIDYTLLKTDATREQIKTLCSEARTYHFASVCIQPTWVEFAAKELDGTDVKVCTVAGFPFGAETKEVKAFEATDAVERGAGEVDMVMNVGLLKSGEVEAAFQDIQAVVLATGERVPVKVILETGFLTDDEKIRACGLAERAGAQYVKTSTGFFTGGATAYDVTLMSRAVSPEIGVKAAGGIRDRKTAIKMVEAGATRIGSSSGVKIVSENV